MLARKFLDAFLVPAERIIFVDADTVFYSHPHELASASAVQGQPWYLLDRRGDSYSFCEDEMMRLVGANILSRVNTGLFVIDLDPAWWLLLEEWAAKLVVDETPSHFTEQSLLAMLFTACSGLAVSPEDYICEPTEMEVRARAGAFHHYVFPGRHLFYAYAWQDILSSYEPTCHYIV